MSTVAEVTTAPRRAPAPARTSAPRYGGLELVRTIAMLSIVAFHVHPVPLFGISFGITTLQVVMCALAARAVVAPPFGPFAQKRATRLLAPFVFWSLAHCVLELVFAWHYEVPVTSRFHWLMFIGGGSFHLWFLPYAFAASVAVYGLARATQRVRQEHVIVISACIGAALVTFGQHVQDVFELETPLELWLDGIAAMAFGLALGRVLTLSGLRRARMVVLVLLLAAVPLTIGPTIATETQLWARYAAAVALACFGFLVPLPENRLVSRLASYNLGVYACHLFALHVVTRTPHLRFAEVGWRIAAVYLLSLGVVIAMRRMGARHVV